MTAAELDRHRYMSLATFRRSGAEVATPVWFAAVDGKLYVVSAGNAGKVSACATPGGRAWPPAMSAAGCAGPGRTPAPA